jgi:hypothetical protein
VHGFVVRLASAETRPEWLNHLPGNRFAVAGFVALALLALYGVALLGHPASPAAARPRAVPLAAATVVCPDASDAQVGAATPPGAHGAGRLAADGTSLALSAPGTATSVTGKKDAGPWTFNATGALAPGLALEQTTSHGGLAGTICPEPISDRWFVGPGPADADEVALSLTNVDARPVDVEADGLGEDGSIETMDGHDVTVAPHATQVVRVGRDPGGLGPIAAGVKLIALHVRAIPGRIVAAVRVQRGKGADWLPATVPSRHLVVPGVPPGKGGRRLLVAVPGPDEVPVRIRVLSPDGDFAPGGQSTLQATALAVTSFDLGLGGKPAGLVLTADRPIVAALVADDGDDFAVTAAVGGIGSGAVLAADRDRTTLMFTAPERPAVVHVTQITTLGPAGAGQDIKVPTGRTVAFTMPATAGAGGHGVSLVPRPGSGPVYAARLLQIKDQGLTLLPITPARTQVFLPPVVDVPLP